ncbi:HIT family protein [Microlunatus capsulatus]|uniref:Diadenosine tetraphosphate (Ap4A) HIT family hydrolase n=1 Tax=Microlunatus capsulatus TaxID=99117 RepID=A0ABS4ZBF7_9ACTN|nr:HIT domain-containing protein [Microlunatus capsulatus]MBP2418095.1 diadenosine tetraphosphate (Ap4A) HIT family hydrolase [Microlunatus capsulatus]
MADDDCLICRKHRGEGPLVGPVVHVDEHVSVSHRATGALGYVFVESRRHVPYLDGLTDTEAEAFGRTTTRLARALKAELDVAYVHVLVTGHSIAHLHQHVVVQHAGTPAGQPWWQEWDGAPHGDVAALAARLGWHLAG